MTTTVSILLLLAIGSIDLWSTSATRGVAIAFQPMLQQRQHWMLPSARVLTTTSTTRTVLSMSSDGGDGNTSSKRTGKKPMNANNPDAMVKSVLNKQIAYDEKSGRFFESAIREEDCAPEEEFCVIDKETGELVRLTQEEKERIFLDSLQVRRWIIL